MTSGPAEGVRLEFVEAPNSRTETGFSGYWRLCLRRKSKRNALNPELIAQLRDQLGKVEVDRGLPLLVVRGDGPSFCAGADLDILASLEPESAGPFITELHRALAALRELDVISVAFVQGARVGVGFELAASCDLRIGRRDAWFSMPEVAVGVPSVVEAALLPRLIGWSATADLVLTGRRMEADEAHHRGLLREVLSGDEWVTAEERLAAEIARLDADAVRSQKRLLRVWEESFPSDAIRAGIDSFRNSYLEPGRVRRRIEDARRAPSLEENSS